MKKTLFLFAAVLLVVSLTAGCLKSKAALEDQYYELNKLINNPTAEIPENLSGEISFNVYIYGEMYEQTFSGEGDDKIYKYQSAMIARNSVQIFYLEVSSLAEPLKKEEFYKITGRIGGSVSYTVDNKMYYILEIFADNAEILEEYDVEYTEGSTFEARSGEDYGKFVFTKACYTKDSEGDLIVLYYTFENLGSGDTVPMIDRFEMSQNRIPLETVNTVPDELDPDAYPSGGSAVMKAQPKGMSGSYYILLRPDKESVKTGEELTIRFYDDGFYVIFSCFLDIENNSYTF